MSKPRYPISTASFEKIRKGNYLYVDKTDFVYSLVSEPGFYFLARPRRFGKSLLISTIEAFYKGKRDLFEGLNIYTLLPEEDWQEYPVLHLDLSATAYLNDHSLLDLLDTYLSKWEEEYNIIPSQNTIYSRFSILIDAIHSRWEKGLVILIDEYDSPLTNSMGNEALMNTLREQLYGFFSILKAKDSIVEFCMLTGVTKYGKISVFSGLNNLNDISLDNQYAAICGITEKELHSFFHDGVETLAQAEQWTIEDTYRQLKDNYDGYHFSKSLVDVYNPYSIIKALSKSEISDYWINSGIPSLLSRTIVDLNYDLSKLTGFQVTQQDLNNLSIFRKDPAALFYQTGYLTIKSYDRETELFTLGYPNREVERGLLGDIINLYIPEKEDISADITKMRSCLINGNPEEFIERLNAFLAGIPSKLRINVGNYENYYHTIFYCVTSLIGLNISTEFNTSKGFIDILITTPNYIYIIELKINGTAKDAMRQIENIKYAAQFAFENKEIFRIGIGFSKTTHNIESYIIE